MGKLSVYYCETCGHYGYFQLQKHAVCPICHYPMKLLNLTYQQFTDLDANERDELISILLLKNSSYVQSLITKGRQFSSRNAIGHLATEINRLEADNQQLNSTVEWMHNTIWDLLRQTKALQKELDNQKAPQNDDPDNKSTC